MDARDLEQRIRRIAGRGYKAYQELRGAFRFPDFELVVDKVQADPFAPPSRMRLIVPKEVASLPPDAYRHPSRRVGLENYLAWVLAREARAVSRRLGSGKSGLVLVHGPGQEMLARSSVSVHPDGTVEVRLFVGLPAAGRRVLAREAWQLLGEELPGLARAVRRENLDAHRLRAFVETCEEADFLRARLADLGLVAFVADGSVLPRASGVDPRPAREAVPFRSPEELAVEVELPHRGRVRGLGIPEGVTLIVGGGFHGKSTLLRALEQGVYNHVPGDGRELVVSRYESVKIRAEDGRAVAGVDISSFVSNLPFGQDTVRFTTVCASGSTSQAANIMEALEAGARVLLIDEDTSATNFMIRDARMQALIAKDREPITPYLDRVRELAARFGVSSVLVVGGAGDYLEVADTVIAMDHFLPRDATAEARLVVERFPSARKPEAREPLRLPEPRRFPPRLFPRDARGPKAKGPETILWARETIDLSAVEQLVCHDQTQALALALPLVVQEMARGHDLRQAVEAVEALVQEKGPASLSPTPRGDLAAFRRFELAAAVSRLRTLAVENS